MESFGINLPLLTAQLANILLIVGWIALTYAALRALRRRSLPSTATAIWSALILLLPLLGALAFFTVRPASAGTRDSGAR